MLTPVAMLGGPPAQGMALAAALPLWAGGSPSAGLGAVQRGEAGPGAPWTTHSLENLSSEKRIPSLDLNRMLPALSLGNL